MKITHFILTVVMAVTLFAGCKKEEEKIPEPENKFAKTFVVEKITTSDYNGEVTHYIFEYDSLNRITVSDQLRFFYNDDGTVRRIESHTGNYLDFRHDNQKRIDRAISYMHQFSEPDTVFFYYGTGSKPDSSYHQYFSLVEKYSYDANGFLNRIDYRSPGFINYSLFDYKNGNLVKATDETVTFEYGYDDKSNPGLAMHLPAEYLLAAELNLNQVAENEIIMQNNMIKYTHINNQEEPFIADFPVLEYNEAGLPTKFISWNCTVEYVYEERP